MKNSKVKSFDLNWEKIYSNSTGSHINRYPYGLLTSYFFRNLELAKFDDNVRILELGCGVGNNLPLALDQNLKIYGVDGSNSAIKIAKKIYDKNSLVELNVMDFASLNFNDNYFNMIIDRQSIECNTIENIENIYSEIFRVLKKSGILISFMINTSDSQYGKVLKNHDYARKIEERTYENFKYDYLKGIGVVHFFTSKEIKRLCKKNFLEILSLDKSSVKKFIPKENIIESEYILVGQKK